MKTVFVGLSGGVDSAVSAALLKEEGYNVVGAFIKIWRPEFVECPWQKERLDAMRVCAHLGIPFKEIDLSEEYKKNIIDDLVTNYARGVTPNPDVLCNRYIKFGAFKEWALKNGADMIATGHYARIDKERLLRGKDANKDQSYFLWQLTSEDLARTLFPVGEYTKLEVRKLAEKFKLPVAKKPDSQGLCFIGDVSMEEFLKRFLPIEKGAVLNEMGKKIGEHDGAALYTIGKRHGFRVDPQTTDGGALYVIAINTTTNTITVAEDVSRAARSTARLSQTNWHTLREGEVQAQVRYRETPSLCRIEEKGSLVCFKTPHIAPPGQSLVVYEQDILLGGGILETV